MRKLRELFRLRFEARVRARLLFAPLAERARAELSLLERLEQHLGSCQRE
ncbi:MAG: hypothetical protein ACXU86_21180 [Archangium sp.]